MTSAGRDWILLPALSFLTVVLILIPTELFARKIFRETATNSFDCLVLHDTKNGIHAIPNSSCLEKSYEGKLVEYHFNSRGHRAGMEYGPKTPDTYRIVLLGTSVTEGLRMPFEKTFAALLPRELSQRTGRKVEVYNEGIMSGTPHLYDVQFKQVLAAQPDLILWTLTKWDIGHVGLVAGDPDFVDHTSEGAGARRRVFGGLLASGWYDRLTGFARQLEQAPPSVAWKQIVDEFDKKSRTVFMLRHLLYQSQSEYVKHYLMQGEAAAYLRTESSPTWRDDLRQFDGYVADIEAKAQAAGVPLVATVLPERAEAAMISMGEWPAGYDPYKFGEQVRAVIERHGGTYIDLLQGFRRIPNPEQYWFPVDMHPNSGGHAIFSGLLAQGLTSGAVPALDPARELRSWAGGGR